MKKLSLGTQTFEKIRDNDYLYVDKTEYIYRLMQGECYFFARPRRFGKSVLCSTLVSLFQGKKEFFKELWITQNTDYAWPVHPVIYLDFGLVSTLNPEIFIQELLYALKSSAENEGIALPDATTPGIMLQSLVVELVKKYNNKVVLIIDEYDRPIVNHLTNQDVLEQMQDIVRNFYTCVKAIDKYLRFLFVTGISRFAKTSLFSGFNQIQDISMDPQFAHLVGYTDQELETYFSDYMTTGAARNKMSVLEFHDKMREYYDGYRFWENLFDDNGNVIEQNHVYNPFSVMHNLNKPTFDCYWFTSGTPTFLIQLLRKNSYPIESFDGVGLFQKELGNFEPTHISLKVLLYQTGYLTIKEHNDEFRTFTLTYPNIEVKEAFLQQILAWISTLEETEGYVHAVKMRKALLANNLDQFIALLKSFYAAIPYNIQLEQEKYYQTIFYIILKLLGINIDVEVLTNIGRIDAVIKTEKVIYILEFKLDGTADKALAQIKDKKYAEAFQLDPRPIILVGMVFSAAKKNIAEVKMEEFKK